MIKIKKKKTINYLYEWAKPHWIGYLLSIICAVVGIGFSIIPYYGIGKIITMLIEKNYAFADYGVWLAIIGCGWLGHIIFHNISTTISHKMTFSVIAETRKRMCDKLAKIPMGKVLGRSSGETKNMIVEKVDSIEPTLAHVVPEVTSKLCAPIAIIIYIFVLDWRMGLLSLLTIPVGFLCAFGMSIGYEKKFGRYVKANKNLNTVAVEYINGIEVIKAFNQSAKSYKKFSDAAKESANSAIDWMRDNQLFHSMMMMILPATLISVLPGGCSFYMNGSLSLINFIMIVIMSMGIIPPLLVILGGTDDIAKIGIIVKDIASLLEEKDLERPNKNVKLENYNIKGKDVKFSYDKNEILHGVNFELKQGTVNALVGPSGSGKSTVAKLIASLWDVDSGGISVGGINVKNIPLKQLNETIAYVSQDSFLFDGTIMENLRVGNQKTSDEEIVEIAKGSGCHEFIMELENGYQTKVGSSGGHLSGGERQRIAIARAMVKNAPIVVFDEATAYTDPENEAKIQNSVAKLVEGKTLIVIAHRLSTIVNADLIMVVENGNIVAKGNHNELIEKNQLYNELWQAHIGAKDNLEVV